MKFELNVGGFVVVVKAEGPVAFQVREAVEAPKAVVPAPVPEAVPSAPAVRVLPPVDAGMFEKLSCLRRSLAAEQGVPPYVIFHDKTLRDIISAMPQDLSEFGSVQGVGQAKLEKYGEKFLEVLRAA